MPVRLLVERLGVQQKEFDMNDLVTESQEFQAWMKRNNNLLRSYAPDQIALLARMNGFSLSVVCSDVSDRVTHIKRLLTFWESPLSEQWMDLTAYERGRTLEDR